MSSGADPFARPEGEQVAEELAREARRVEASFRWVTVAHFSSTVATVVGALYIGLVLAAGRWDWFAGSSAACLAGLLVAQALRPLIMDVYTQLQYRDKFLLFLAYLSIALIPPAVGGMGVLPFGFAVLLALLCLKAVAPLFFARVLAASVLLVLGSVMATPAVEGWMVCLWAMALLASIRFGSVRWRLENHGEGYGMDLGAMWGHSLLPILGPPLVAWAAWEYLYRHITPRDFTFAITLRQDPELTLRDLSAEHYQGLIFLFAALIIIILLLYWLDRKLRRRKAGTAEEFTEMPTTVREFEQEAPAGIPPELLQEEGPRGRILRAFLEFSGALAITGLERQEGETARQYVSRLQETDSRLTELRDEALPLFEDACYGVRDFTGPEADRFERTTAEALRALLPKE